MRMDYVEIVEKLFVLLTCYPGLFKIVNYSIPVNVHNLELKKF